MSIYDILSRDFKEFIVALCKNKVKFVIIGGYAVNYYGYVRYTGDLDILCVPEDLTALGKVVRDFYNADMGLDTLDYGKMLRIGLPPNRIEVLSQIDGITSKEVYKGSKVVEVLEGWEVRVISKADLIQNKRASGRPKDIVDLEALGDTIDFRKDIKKVSKKK